LGGTFVFFFLGRARLKSKGQLFKTVWVAIGELSPQPVVCARPRSDGGMFPCFGISPTERPKESGCPPGPSLGHRGRPGSRSLVTNGCTPAPGEGVEVGRQGGPPGFCPPLGLHFGDLPSCSTNGRPIRAARRKWPPCPSKTSACRLRATQPQRLRQENSSSSLALGLAGDSPSPASPEAWPVLTTQLVVRCDGAYSPPPAGLENVRNQGLKSAFPACRALGSPQQENFEASCQRPPYWLQRYHTAEPLKRFARKQKAGQGFWPHQRPLMTGSRHGSAGRLESGLAREALMDGSRPLETPCLPAHLCLKLCLPCGHQADRPPETAESWAAAWASWRPAAVFSRCPQASGLRRSRTRLRRNAGGASRTLVSAWREVRMLALAEPPARWGVPIFVLWDVVVAEASQGQGLGPQHASRSCCTHRRSKRASGLPDDGPRELASTERLVFSYGHAQTCWRDRLLIQSG